MAPAASNPMKTHLRSAAHEGVPPYGAHLARHSGVPVSPTCTHTSDPGHEPSAAQASSRPRAAHAFATHSCVEAQSASDRHATHARVDVLHLGVAGVEAHSLSPPHPGSAHVPERQTHPPVQCVSVVHATQAPDAQCVVAVPAHSASVRHPARQAPDVQTWAGPQSAATAQATHTPLRQRDRAGSTAAHSASAAQGAATQAPALQAFRGPQSSRTRHATQA